MTLWRSGFSSSDSIGLLLFRGLHIVRGRPALFLHLDEVRSDINANSRSIAAVLAGPVTIDYETEY